MPSITIGTLNSRTNKASTIHTKEIYINLHPVWEREYEAWSESMKTALIETIFTGLKINPIWVITNPEEERKDMLDGLHRSTTVIKFINNNVKIHKKYLMEDKVKNLLEDVFEKKNNVKKTKGKMEKDTLYFDELPSVLQQQFMDYEIDCNILDESFHYDKDKRNRKYVQLNRTANAHLNKFEINKSNYHDYFTILAEYKDDLNNIFFGKKDYRGDIEEEIMDIIVLSEPLPCSWGSMTKIKEIFLNNIIGTIDKDITEYLAENNDYIHNKLNFIKKVIIYLKDENMFSKNKKTFNTNYFPYKCIIGRLVFFFNQFKNNIALFHRHIPELLIKLQEEITNVNNIQIKLECGSRNAIFQKKLIQLIDDIIKTSYEDTKQKRLFPKAEIETKYKEQGNVCAICKQHKGNYEGDHIKEWSKGGTTTYDNLQVLCVPCHRNKIKTSI